MQVAVLEPCAGEGREEDGLSTMDICLSCGVEIGEGELGTRSPAGATCIVCLLDVEALRERCEQAGYDMAIVNDLIDRGRRALDEFRGQALQRRARRQRP
jgi:hypothetical protein